MQALLTAWVLASIGGGPAPGEHAHADAKMKTVMVRVIDAGGDVLPRATVTVEPNGDRHWVNTQSGEWADTMEYLSDGTELPFEPGLALTLSVGAPGYALREISHEVVRGRNRVEVVLEPLPAPAASPCVTAALGDAKAVFDEVDVALGVAEGVEARGCLLRARSWAGVLAWHAAEAAYVSAGDEAARDAAASARNVADTVVGDWLEWAHAAGADVSEARALCRSVTGRVASCP